MIRYLDAYAQRHVDLTRKILTRAITFGTKRLIVFLTPGLDLRTGGILSIARIYRETEKLRDLHKARVTLCTLPDDPVLLKYTWFENSNYILNLESVLKSSRGLDYLLLHIPEYCVNRVLDWLTTAPTLIKMVRDAHFNILLQNWRLSIPHGRF